MDFKLNIFLKQQTPYIHFQHDQYGATLRASEVKPKLDKFILEKEGGDEKVKKDNPSWFIKKGVEALNYKMRFILDGKPKKPKEVGEIYDYKLYFGNMGKNTQKKNIVFQDVIMEIVCFIPDILDAIKKYVCEFFLLNNFGCRQSKGFGGFVVSKIGDEKIQYDTIEKITGLIKEKLYFYTDTDKNDCKEIMNHAMVIYGILKGGFNLPGIKKRYIKSYIQRAFLDALYGDNKGKKTGSEKAFIKFKKSINENTTSNKEKKQGNKTSQEYGQYKFIRLMLGMADTYKYTGLSQGEINVYNLGKDDFGIVRFKSPITIKIVGKYILFLFDKKAFKLVENKVFYLLDKSTLDYKGRKVLNGNNYTNKKTLIKDNGWEISTPETFGEDEIKKLIIGYVDYFNKNNSTLNEFDPPHNKLELKTEVK